MTNTITFNYLKDGIIGHTSVTIANDDLSMTLSSSADIMGFPLGVYSTRHEQFRKWSSIRSIEKKIIVDDVTFAQVKDYFDAVRETRSDYGYLFGTNCLDFTQDVYRLIGEDGSFADLFTSSELAGPIAGKVLLWRNEAVAAGTEIDDVQATYYDDGIEGTFGISGGIILLFTLIAVYLALRPPKRLFRRAAG
ncbi:MAG: hypothetical protein KDJ16_18410 [Hyphomicrobiales bacterium]|nr:hypothetical protein [Hyphomicrobiales bacterium]